MKIAFLSPSADRSNGWGAITFEVCNAYAQKFDLELDFELHLPITEKNQAYLAELPFNNKVIFSLPPFAHSFRNPKRLWQYFLACPPILNVDLIHCLDFPYAVVGMHYARRAKIPYLITLCGTYYQPFFNFPDKWLFSLAYQRAANVNAISQYTLALAQKKFKIPKIKTEIIHAGVNYERFHQPVNPEAIMALRTKYGADKKIILGVGALKDRKGFDVVIRAMAKVKEAVPEAIYLIAGSGTETEKLQQLIVQLGLEKTVFLVGQVPDQDLPTYFQACDLYCHTPRQIGPLFEGFGIVYLEAGAAGKPVVGSNSGGVSDAIIDGITGRLVREGDVNATATAIIEILSNQSLSKEMSENGTRYAAEHAWKNIVAQYIATYKKTLQN